MPGVTAIIRKELLQDRTLAISRAKVESVRHEIKVVTAEEMSSLDWNNKELKILEPFSQVTPVIMLAGDLTLGDPIEISTPDVAAIVYVWAFDYPSRDGVCSMNELDRFDPTDQELIRRKELIAYMETRLEQIRDRLKKTLGTDLKIEMNFVPQRDGCWVGG